MLQADFENKLKVWKDLAISKQVLMGAATKALGLDPECSADELRKALEESIKRAQDADAAIAGMREQTDQELTKMKAALDSSEKALAEAQAEVTAALEAREAAERQLVAGKADNAKAIKQAKADVADKQNKIKAISVALADTPENVVKKLKTLKKQKLEDSRARMQIEAQLRTVRKEKSELEQEVETQKTELEQYAPLVAQLREMHAACHQANDKIRALSGDEPDLVTIPELDEALLETLDKTTPEASSEA